MYVFIAISVAVAAAAAAAFAVYASCSGRLRNMEKEMKQCLLNDVNNLLIYQDIKVSYCMPV